MADVTVSSVEVKDGVLHIFGSNFTQTTTTVFVDDEKADHEYVSATELTVDPAPQAGSSVAVEKAGVRTDQMPVLADLTTQQDAPGATGVVSEDANATGPMTPSQPYPEGTPTFTQVAPPTTPADHTTEQEKEAMLAGSEGNTGLLPAEDARTEQEKVPGVGPISEPVEPVEKVETIQQLGIGPREPYPTGNPPDPEEAFRQAHGYYRRTPGGEAPAEVTGNLSDPHAGPDPAGPSPEPEEAA